MGTLNKKWTMFSAMIAAPAVYFVMIGPLGGLVSWLSHSYPYSRIAHYSGQLYYNMYSPVFKLLDGTRYEHILVKYLELFNCNWASKLLI